MQVLICQRGFTTHVQLLHVVKEPRKKNKQLKTAKTTATTTERRKREGGDIGAASSAAAAWKSHRGATPKFIYTRALSWLLLLLLLLVVLVTGSVRLPGLHLSSVWSVRRRSDSLRFYFLRRRRRRRRRRQKGTTNRGSLTCLQSLIINSLKRRKKERKKRCPPVWFVPYSLLMRAILFIANSSVSLSLNNKVITTMYNWRQISGGVGTLLGHLLCARH